MVALPEELWERLAGIAERESADTGQYISRNDVIREMLTRACEEYERDEQKKPKSKG